MPGEHLSAIWFRLLDYFGIQGTVTDERLTLQPYADSVTVLSTSSHKIIKYPNLDNLTGLTSITNETAILETPPGLLFNTALLHVKLKANALTESPDFSNCVLLEDVDLSSNDLTSMPSFSANTAIVTIDLHDNSITDVSDLSGLDQLVTLDLSDNDINDFTSVEDLLALVTLDLSGNALSVANVDAWLASCVLLATDGGVINATLDLSGGTNGIPGTQGQLDVTDLHDNFGWTVTVNS